MKAGRTARGGFTLIELMVVILIIGILLGLLLSAFQKAAQRAKIRKRSADRDTIELALRAFRHEYQRWPYPPAHEGSADRTYADDNYLVVQVLTNTVMGTGTRVDFLKSGDFLKARNGSLVTPFHTSASPKYYKITLDTDLSGAVPGGGEVKVEWME